MEPARATDEHDAPKDAESIFATALSLSHPERSAYVKQACVGNPHLAAKVDGLLRSYDQVGGFLPAESSGPNRELDLAGTAIGPYQIIRQIGLGGCGEVYLAEQERPIRRQVALKIIKAGMDTRSVIARFEAERQALAMMDHPNIAKVFDAGATKIRRPYFVMELVEGTKITEYCADKGLTTAERLRLFLRVCDAVQHAHQKGIIHRDLKPSNILVSSGAPKVIDFGIAKATCGKLGAETIQTLERQFIGTPAYMSPEQADLSGDIDTRADIYSLGVLLYELVTGRPPFDNHELLTAGLEEMRRIIREVDPKRPSQIAANLSRAKLSNSTTPNPQLSIDEDLDYIILKCLEKNRSRRFETAGSLAEDIQRHLQHEPIRARPRTPGYRLRKFAERHRTSAIAASLVIITLLAATVFSARHAFLARRSEQAANRARDAEAAERRRAEQQLSVMLGMMNDAFEGVSLRLGDMIGSGRVRRDLSAAAEGVVKLLERERDPAPEIREMLGAFYLQLSYAQAWGGYLGNTSGEFDHGLVSAQRAIRYFESVADQLSPDDLLTRLTRAEMSSSFACAGLLRFDDALAHVAKGIDYANRLVASDKPRAVAIGAQWQTWGRQLTAFYLISAGKSEDALKLHLSSFLPDLEARAGDWQHASRAVLWDLDGELQLIGQALLRLDRIKEAEKYLRRRRELAELGHARWPYNGGWFGNLSEARTDLGEALLSLGENAEATPIVNAALALADSLTEVDPTTAAILKVRVLRGAASGYVRSVELKSVDRVEHLRQASDTLATAENIVATLNPQTLQTFLRHELRRVNSRLKVVSATLSVEENTKPFP